MWGFFPFLLSFSLTLINPIFGGDFQDVLCNHYCNNSHYIPNQTAVNRQSKTIYLFTGKSTGNKKGLSITAIKEAWKVANRQIKDPITVSYFFFARAPPSFLTALPLATRHSPLACALSSRTLILPCLKRKIRDCSQSKSFLKWDSNLMFKFDCVLLSDKVVKRDKEMQKVCDNGGFCCTTKNSRFTTTRN